MQSIEGKWYTTTRSGNRYEIKHPAKQAKNNKYALIEKIEEIFGKKTPFIPASILIIFPDSGLPDTLGAGENISNYVAHDEVNNLGKIIINKMLEKNKEDFLGQELGFLNRCLLKKLSLNYL